MTANIQSSPLPQNISINVGGNSGKHFIDRHFAAVLAFCGVVGASIIAGIYKVNETNSEPVHDFEIATAEPLVKKPVKFLVSEVKGFRYILHIGPVDDEGSGKAAEAARSGDGIFYVWTPDMEGEYVAELSVIGEKGAEFEKTLKFVVKPSGAAPTLGTNAALPGGSPEFLSQSFSYRIGDNSSCTEKNVARTFDLCLPPGYTVLDWSGSYQSKRNGTAAVERHPSQVNCVVLTLQYSDSGRGPLGDCKGNGWVDYATVVNGRTSSQK